MNEPLTDTLLQVPTDTLGRTAEFSAAPPRPAASMDSIPSTKVITSAASTDSITSTVSKTSVVSADSIIATGSTPPAASTDSTTSKASVASTASIHTATKTVSDESAAPTDSLSLRQEIDRSHDYPFRVYCTPDSLRAIERSVLTHRSHALQQTQQEAPSPYTEVFASTVYGLQSVLVRTPHGDPHERPLTDNALFQGFFLLLAVIYILLIYHNLPDIRTLLSRIFHNPHSDNHHFQEPGGSRYARFMRTIATIGTLFIGIFAVKYGQSLVADFPAGRFSFAAAALLSLTVSVLFLLVIGYQWSLLRLVGALTLTQPLIAQLRQLRKLYFSGAVVIVTPALLLLTLCPQHTGLLWFGLIVIELTVTIFLYLRETLTLFLSKKVSIIHWILYLCSVELFPVSLLWQLAVR